MSVTGRGGVGIPTVLLYEAEGLVISVEAKSGVLYRGLLDSTDDFMNLKMKNVRRSDPSTGEDSKMEQVYIRGSNVTLVVFPEVLSQSPMFKRVIKFKQSKSRYIPQGAGTGTDRPGPGR